jgi:hypothetical protein
MSTETTTRRSPLRLPQLTAFVRLYGEVFMWAALLMIPLGLSATWGRARWRRPERGPA